MLPTKPARTTSNGKDGYALVAVLVFCLILIPVVATFAQSSKTSAKVANSDNQASRIEFMLDGLADAIASKLTFDRTFAEHAAAGITCTMDDVRITVAFQDHDGKIDLNNAGTELLHAGFAAAGLTIDQARLLQEYVEASRSGGALPRELMATPDLPSIKGTPFERVEEIYDVTQALNVRPRDLDAYFTVYKRNGSLELPAAKDELRAGLEGSPDIEGVSEVDNGSFDYLDVLLAASSSGGRAFALSKTYRRISNDGEISPVASRRPAVSGRLMAPTAADRDLDCLDMLRTKSGEVANG